MLAELLQDHIEATSQLLELLLREYAALKARNLAELGRLMRSKQTSLDRLQELTERLAGYLGQRGFNIDAGGIQACIAGYEPRARLHLEAIWTAWRDIAAQARQQNEINGAIISASRNSTEQALAILKGRDPRSCLYDHDAHPTFSSGSHSLARA